MDRRSGRLNWLLEAQHLAPGPIQREGRKRFAIIWCSYALERARRSETHELRRRWNSFLMDSTPMFFTQITLGFPQTATHERKTKVGFEHHRFNRGAVRDRLTIFPDNYWMLVPLDVRLGLDCRVVFGPLDELLLDKSARTAGRTCQRQV